MTRDALAPGLPKSILEQYFSRVPFKINDQEKANWIDGLGELEDDNNCTYITLNMWKDYTRCLLFSLGDQKLFYSILQSVVSMAMTIPVATKIPKAMISKSQQCNDHIQPSKSSSFSNTKITIYQSLPAAAGLPSQKSNQSSAESKNLLTGPSSNTRKTFITSNNTSPNVTNCLRLSVLNLNQASAESTNPFSSTRKTFITSNNTSSNITNCLEQVLPHHVQKPERSLLSSQKITSDAQRRSRNKETNRFLEGRGSPRISISKKSLASDNQVEGSRYQQTNSLETVKAMHQGAGAALSLHVESNPRHSRRHKAGSTQISNMSAGLMIIIDRLKEMLKSRGAHGMLGLARCFRLMDIDHSEALSFSEFSKALRECEFTHLSDKDIHRIFEHFDADQNGYIEFSELMNIFRDPMNPRRRHFVHQAFQSIDVNHNGVLEVSDIIQTYHASQHPEVLAGAKSEDHIFREFLNTFDDDQQISLREWEHYYHNISAMIDDDDYFELMMRNVWHLHGEDTVEEIQNDVHATAEDARSIVSHEEGSNVKQVIQNKDKQTSKSAKHDGLIQFIRSSLRHDHGGIVRLWRSLCSRRNAQHQLIRWESVHDAFSENNIRLSLVAVQSFCDMVMEQEQQCGFVSVEKIIQALTGELSPLALAQVKDVYHQLVAKSTPGVLTPDIVIANYDAANHPEVRFGQMKTAQEVFQEFASSFDFTDVEKKGNDGPDLVITWESFYQYCCNLYWSCGDEAYFRVILESVFHDH